MEWGEKQHKRQNLCTPFPGAPPRTGSHWHLVGLLWLPSSWKPLSTTWQSALALTRRLASASYIIKLLGFVSPDWTEEPHKVRHLWSNNADSDFSREGTQKLRNFWKLLLMRQRQHLVEKMRSLERKLTLFPSLIKSQSFCLLLNPGLNLSSWINLSLIEQVSFPQGCSNLV